jgi:hypothetical protein
MIFICMHFIRVLVKRDYRVPITFFQVANIEPLDKDVVEEFPAIAAGFEDFQNSFHMDLDVPGQTCVYLAAGKAKHVLKGKYWDCEQDIQVVVDHASEVKEYELYELKVEFLGGLPNDGGTAKMP